MLCHLEFFYNSNIINKIPFPLFGMDTIINTLSYIANINSSSR